MGETDIRQNQSFQDHPTLASHTPHEHPWTRSRLPSEFSILNLSPPEEDYWENVLCLEFNVSRKI